MPMLPWEYVFYKMAVLCIDTTKEPLKLCRKKIKTAFHDIPCPFVEHEIWTALYFSTVRQPHLCSQTEQRPWKKPGRKEGLRKNLRKSSLYYSIYIYIYIYIYLYIYCIMAIKQKPKMANCKNKNNLRNHLHASYQHRIPRRKHERKKTDF